MKQKLISTVKQQKIATDILRRCIKISNQTPHDVFCEYSPHVNQIAIWVHIGGWESGVSGVRHEINFDTYYFNPEKAYQHVSAILAELEKDIK